MRTFNLVRQETGDEGTFGTITSEPQVPYSNFTCKTAELPWRDNKSNVSCLPVGSYMCEWDWSEKRKRNVYFIRENFPDRDAFQIHSGNFVGDVLKGLKSDVEGCILLGKKLASMGGQKAIIDSRLAVGEFESLLGGETFKSNITEDYHV
jgi:hypothetical protein